MRVLSKEDLALTIKMRKDGKSAEQIAKHFGITKRAVQGRLAVSIKEKITFIRKCPFCNETFETTDITKLYCSNAHTKRANRKKQRVILECLLPECSNTFLGIKGTNKFCCKKHGDLHSKRILNGVYDRIVNNSKKCLACDESVILDEHHIEFYNDNGKVRSNKKSKTIYLCPTHHLAIHRGYAVIVDGKYVNIVSLIRKKLKMKVGTT